MSSCEKCWRDAHDGSGEVAKRYGELIEERRAHPCTPEEQAGPDAAACDVCGRKTRHQWTGERMCGCFEDLREQAQLLKVGAR